MSESDFRAALDDWEAAFGEFFAALDTVPALRRNEAGVCGSWSVREIVAHLAGWHAIALSRYADFDAGDPAQVRYDLDAVNAENVTRRAHLDWTQTLAELRVRMGSLREHVEGLIAHGNTGDQRYVEWLHGLAKDARLHAGEIIAWAQQFA
jgi:hypothetical protein